MVEATLRRFMGWEDAHYPGGLVSGGHLVELFGDVGTELSMRQVSMVIAGTFVARGIAGYTPRWRGYFYDQPFTTRDKRYVFTATSSSPIRTCSITESCRTTRSGRSSSRTCAT